MINYKVVLGSLSVAVALAGYIPYIWNMIRGKTKPHAFSWLVWALLEGITFFAQISKGSGAGAWVTGVGAMIAGGVAVAAFINKDKEITVLDWTALSGAGIGIILWQVTKNPLTAVISVTIADALGFIPTFRKGYHKPDEETVLEYFLSTVKYTISIFALQSYSLTTWLYPASLILTNSLFVTMALVRRKQIKR